MATSGGIALRKSARKRTLRPYAGRLRASTCLSKRSVVGCDSTMINDASSSSDESKTDDKAMATCMMNLAIVSAHVQKKAAKEVLVAGNFAS